MKCLRTLSVASAALLTSTAWAESYVTTAVASLPEFNGSLRNGGVALYGSVDMGINYQNAAGKSVWQTQSGGEWTSKFGIFGREDLGGGLKSVLQKQLAAGTMKRLHLQEGTPPGKLCLAYPSVDLMTTTARDFTVWLRSYFRKSERGDQITLGAG
jgi:hypothetical protein